MEYLEQRFRVEFSYKVHFTTHLFDLANTQLRSFLYGRRSEGTVQKLLFVIDKGVTDAFPGLAGDIKTYFAKETTFRCVDQVLIVPGGENAKNDEGLFHEIINAVNLYGIDRHSYLIAIGGGSILDLAGYAAAVSHRGIRHIRIPTTVLSQNDSGVGVKNGINYFGKKNFLGTFAPPVAVFNDYHFLTTLEDRDWRSGISEAIKVALIKDADFFYWIVEHADKLARRDMPAMQYLIVRCAELHLQHIAGKDPFETGSSRPLDFGHWSAHKLEQLTEFSIRHGEAVAMGIALDTVYSHLEGRLPEKDMLLVISLIRTLGFDITHPAFEITDDKSLLLRGLNEFREHLGGKLTIMLLNAIGSGQEVNEMDAGLLKRASEWLVQHQ
jgi:3-dehydroquinate synthase